MAANLFTPILNDRMRSVHFFNGRLLTGEDMTAEQRGHDAVHELLGNAIGDGIVHGLEVTIDSDTTLAAPLVKVTKGVAINRKGETLLLPSDTRVQLVRTADPTPPARTLFTACTPPESGVYVAGAGVYLLTLCSTVAADGSTAVSGLGGQPAGCNTRFAVDAVQFRLLELPMTDAEMQDIAHLRNVVAYRCFGVSSSFATDPFGTVGEPPTLLDQLRPRSLTDCDVPLATFYWTATGGLVWGDMWSVRRRVTHWTGGGANARLLVDDLRLSAAEAMLSQFEAHLATLIAASSTPTDLVARDTFRWLPPLGRVPLAMPTRKGIAYEKFFEGRSYEPPRFVNANKLLPIVLNFIPTAPIDFTNDEMLWLYDIVQNVQAANAGSSVQKYLLFSTGQIPYQADAQYDVSYWNYSNYS